MPALPPPICTCIQGFSNFHVNPKKHEMKHHKKTASNDDSMITWSARNFQFHETCAHLLRLLGSRKDITYNARNLGNTVAKSKCCSGTRSSNQSCINLFCLRLHWRNIRSKNRFLCEFDHKSNWSNIE